MLMKLDLIVQRRKLLRRLLLLCLQLVLLLQLLLNLLLLLLLLLQLLPNLALLLLEQELLLLLLLLLLPQLLTLLLLPELLLQLLLRLGLKLRDRCGSRRTVRWIVAHGLHGGHPCDWLQTLIAGHNEISHSVLWPHQIHLGLTLHLLRGHNP